MIFILEILHELLLLLDFEFQASHQVVFYLQVHFMLLLELSDFLFILFGQAFDFPVCSSCNIAL